MERAFGREVLFTKEGGSGPEADLADILGAPLVFVAVGLDADRIHAPNEYVDLSRLLPGPFCTLYLAQLGAEVLKIEEIDVPSPGKGEVQIRVHALGLNRAESMFRRGQYLEEPKLPARPGTASARDQWE